MRNVLATAVAGTLLFGGIAGAQQQETYDYWQQQRRMIRQGQQAIFMCNGLFTSNRTLEQVFAQELAFLPEPVGTPEGGDYEVDTARKAVVIGNGHGAPKMRAAFREGVGCVILAPDQTLDDIDGLPILELPYPAGAAAEIAWPDGDKVEDRSLPAHVDAAALQAASDWAFHRESPEQVTLSLMVVHQGEIIHERYAPGFDMTTRTRTWSTAKSIASTLMGMLVDEGKLKLDEPLGYDFFPAAAAPDRDPRSEITLRHVLNMSSGLEPVDNSGREYAIGSGLSYWAGTSSVIGARSRGAIREPGTNWDYENYDTLLGVYAMKLALGDEKAYSEFPRRRLLDRIGDAQHPGQHGPLRRLHPQQPGLHERARPGPLRPALSAGRSLERRAADLGGLDRLRPHAGAGHGRDRQLLRRTVLAGAGRAHRRAEVRVLHVRQPRAVRRHRADARPRHRAARARLRAPGIRPLEPDPRGARGDRHAADPGGRRQLNGGRLTLACPGRVPRRCRTRPG